MTDRGKLQNTLLYLIPARLTPKINHGALVYKNFVGGKAP